MARVSATRTLENALRRVGFAHVAGVDEVGRGCLAGPVVAGSSIGDTVAEFSDAAGRSQSSSEGIERHRGNQYSWLQIVEPQSGEYLLLLNNRP